VRNELAHAELKGAQPLLSGGESPVLENSAFGENVAPRSAGEPFVKVPKGGLVQAPLAVQRHAIARANKGLDALAGEEDVFSAKLPPHAPRKETPVRKHYRPQAGIVHHGLVVAQREERPPTRPMKRQVYKIFNAMAREAVQPAKNKPKEDAHN